MFLDIVGVGFLVWFFVVIADGWHCHERKSLLRAALSCGVKSLGGNAATNHTDFGGNVWTGRPQIKSQPDPKQIPSPGTKPKQSQFQNKFYTYLSNGS